MNSLYHQPMRLEPQEGMFCINHRPGRLVEPPFSAASLRLSNACIIVKSFTCIICSFGLSCDAILIMMSMSLESGGHPYSCLLKTTYIHTVV